MADLDKLKSARSKAQAMFTKRAKALTRPGILEPAEILREWNLFKTDFFKVTDAGYECAEALREAKDEASATEIDSKTEDCENRFLEIKKATQETFWASYAEEVFFKQAKIADSAISLAEEEEGTSPPGPIKSRRLRNRGIERELVELTCMLAEWKDLIPGSKSLDLNSRYMALNKRVLALHDKLEDDEADQFKGSSIARDPLKDASFLSLPDMTADLQPKPNPDQAATPITATQSTQPTQLPSQLHTELKPQISLQRARLPTFSGDIKDYYCWKAEWEDLQELGNPHGADCIKKFHLLNSLTEDIKKDLVLSSCKSANDVFKLLDNKYGNKAKIVLLIANEVQSLPPVEGDNPRKTIKLIQSVERALCRLQVLNEEDALKNRIIAQSLESKLPTSLKKEWIMYKTDPANDFNSLSHFDHLLTFLKKQEGILEELDQLELSPADNSPGEKGSTGDSVKGAKKAFTKSTRWEEGDHPNCIVCGDDSHAGRLYACKTFREEDIPAKMAHVKKLGSCAQCLRFHPKNGKGCTLQFLCPKADCRKGVMSDHHYLLCPNPLTSTENGNREGPSTSRAGGIKLGLTVKQEEFLAELTPEQREKYKEAFSNKVRSTVCTNSRTGHSEDPVVMMLLNVTTNSGNLIGTLIDLASDTNYITHTAAERLGLSGEEIKLIVHGVGGMRKTVLTKRYTLRLKIKTLGGKIAGHTIICYGLDNIAEITQRVSPKQLQKIFPQVPRDELVRPTKVDLLISHREGRLVPTPTTIVGDLVLWDGPLGKAVGGTHPSLKPANLAMHSSGTHFARSMHLASLVYSKTGIPGGEDGRAKDGENVHVPSTAPPKKRASKGVEGWPEWQKGSDPQKRPRTDWSRTTAGKSQPPAVQSMGSLQKEMPPIALFGALSNSKTDPKAGANPGLKTGLRDGGGNGGPAVPNTTLIFSKRRRPRGNGLLRDPQQARSPSKHPRNKPGQAQQPAKTWLRGPQAPDSSKWEVNHYGPIQRLKRKPAPDSSKWEVNHIELSHKLRRNQAPDSSKWEVARSTLSSDHLLLGRAKQGGDAGEIGQPLHSSLAPCQNCPQMRGNTLKGR